VDPNSQPNGSVGALILAAVTLASASARELSGEGLAEACTSCHGLGGRSQGYIPSIAEVEKTNLLRQLKAFRAQTAQTAQATIMNRIARAYTGFTRVQAARRYDHSICPRGGRSRCLSRESQMTDQSVHDVRVSAAIGQSCPLRRREAMLALGGGILISIVPLPAPAADADTDTDTAAAIRQVYGDRVPNRGRITLQLPALAETGNSVPLTMIIDSSMTAQDRVLRASVFSNRNPRPLIATTLFGPRSRTPTFSTNMRLSGTQDVIGIAEMSDHSLWSAQVRVMGTVGACDALQMRY
jgi:sulfur-oxidizing protein SoxY